MITTPAQTTPAPAMAAAASTPEGAPSGKDTVRFGKWLAKTLGLAATNEQAGASEDETAAAANAPLNGQATPSDPATNAASPGSGKTPETAALLTSLSAGQPIVLPNGGAPPASAPQRDVDPAVVELSQGAVHDLTGRALAGGSSKAKRDTTSTDTRNLTDSKDTGPSQQQPSVAVLAVGMLPPSAEIALPGGSHSPSSAAPSDRHGLSPSLGLSQRVMSGDTMASQNTGQAGFPGAIAGEGVVARTGLAQRDSKTESPSIGTPAVAMPMHGQMPPSGPSPPASPMAPAAPSGAHSNPDGTTSGPAAQIAPAVVSLVQRNDGTHQLVLHLQPAELGQVQVRIDRADGAPAKVEITVQRPETAALLLHDQPQLQHALDQAGIPQDGRSLTIQVATPAPPAAAPAPVPAASGDMSSRTDAGSSGFAGGGFNGNGSSGHPSGSGQPRDDRPAGQSVYRWFRAGLDITA